MLTIIEDSHALDMLRERERGLPSQVKAWRNFPKYNCPFHFSTHILARVSLSGWVEPSPF